MLVQVNGSNTSSLLSGVWCFNNADCELSDNALAPLHGKSRMSRGVVMAAECLGAVREVQGYAHVPTKTVLERMLLQG